jgi:hypothetical protein
VLSAVALALAVVPAARVSAQDAFVGTWLLNVAKSKFTPGPAPKNQTAVYEVAGAGLKVTATGTDGAGNPISTSYTANFDGKDYPVTGNANYDAVMLKRVSANRIEFTRKKAGKVVQTGSIVVSKDGKTRTVTADGTNAGGVKMHSVSVYEKK